MTEEQNTKNLTSFEKDDYYKISPIIIAMTIPVLTLLGYIRLYVYYSVFGIDISNYLEMGEVLISFMNIITYFFTLLIIAILIIYHTPSKPAEKETNELSIYKKLEKNKESLWERSKIYCREYRWIFGLILLLEIITIGLHIINQSPTLFLIEIGWVVVMVYILLIHELSVAHYKNKSSAMVKYIINTLFFFILTTAGISAYAFCEGFNVKFRNQNEKITYDFGVYCRSRNPEKIYIGQTRTHVFLYDKVKNESLALEIATHNTVFFPVNLF